MIKLNIHLKFALAHPIKSGYYVKNRESCLMKMTILTPAKLYFIQTEY